MEPKTKSKLLITLVGAVATLRCSMWREIEPCTCTRSDKYIRVNCDNHASYDELSSTLAKGQFSPLNRVHLDINGSQLHDLHLGTFANFNMTIENLKLNHVRLGQPLNESTFEGLQYVKYLSLADTILDEVPENLWPKMPSLGTLDLGRSNLHYLNSSNFQNLPSLAHIIIPGNNIAWMDRNTFPRQLLDLHIGRNRIHDLNHTLVHLTTLKWLFLNANQLTTLEGQLPNTAPMLSILHANDNRLESLPQQLKQYPKLDSLFFQNNSLVGLDGALAKSRNLERVYLGYNFINTLSKDDFTETENLKTLSLEHNLLTTLNNSLVNLAHLSYLDVSHNRLEEFSLQDVVGLNLLECVVLSHNRISKLSAPPSNAVEWNIKVQELYLSYNYLESLNGALSNLPHLRELNISNNRLKLITPDDFIGLDQLDTLDLSYNQLTTLEEMSKTFLPKLSILQAKHNKLTILDRDFHGLPVLCNADFQHNQIYALGRDLVAKTRCQKPSASEGTWDMLIIDLQDNPILCDAALPEITSLMEVNHTKITGVTKTCLPLSEQPVTSRINAFLGYIPENTTQTNNPTNNPELHVSVAVQEEPLAILPIMTDSSNNVPFVPQHSHEQYTVETQPSNELAPLPPPETNLGNLSAVEQPPPEAIENAGVVETVEERLEADERQISELKLKILELEKLANINNKTDNSNTTTQAPLKKDYDEDTRTV